MHSPDHAELRREASRKGGRNRSAQARARAALPEAMDTGELSGVLTKLLRDVIAGDTEPRVGTAAATLARVLIEVRTAVELEDRIADLEQRADAFYGQKGTDTCVTEAGDLGTNSCER